MSLKFRDLLADTVAEFNRMENFCRIYPAKNCKMYDKYFSGNKHLAKVMYKVLYTAEVIPFGVQYSGVMRVQNSQMLAKVPIINTLALMKAKDIAAKTDYALKSEFQRQKNLKSATSSSKNERPDVQPIEESKKGVDLVTPIRSNGVDDTRQGYQTVPDQLVRRILGTNSNKSSMINAAASTQISSESRLSDKKGSSKVMITGDDILIEYVSRLVQGLQSLQMETVPVNQIVNMEKFVTHYVWKQPD